MKLSLVLFAVISASLALALPIRLTKRADPAFTYANSVYQNAINCPNGIQNKAGGVVLLVHGTASTVEETWSDGPYVNILPNDPNGPGYDVCTVQLPMRALGDVQINAEYVAYAIKYLAPKSTTQQIAIIGWSQGGGLNPQWALKYFPDTRPLVSDYIALAGDFLGTDEGAPACTVLALAQGGCNPAVIQQTRTPQSEYLKAQNSGIGGAAIVPTTSIYTLQDEIVQDQIINPTSALPGATVLPLQAANVCGPLHLAEHFAMPYDTAAYGLALNALTHSGTAQIADFDTAYCTSFNTPISDSLAQQIASGPAILREAVNGISAIVAYPKVQQEPQLMNYVCVAGDAPAGSCAPPPATFSNSPIGRRAGPPSRKRSTNLYRDIYYLAY